LIRALANSGRAIVSTEGASPDDIEDLQRQLSAHTIREPQGEDREPKLQRTEAASRPSRSELEGMRIAQLKELMSRRGMQTEGLLEKKDLVDRLLE
jgi:hypothetical protein